MGVDAKIRLLAVENGLICPVILIKVKDLEIKTASNKGPLLCAVEVNKHLDISA